MEILTVKPSIRQAISLLVHAWKSKPLGIPTEPLSHMLRQYAISVSR
jgi:hypothetical protein